MGDEYARAVDRSWVGEQNVSSDFVSDEAGEPNPRYGIDLSWSPSGEADVSTIRLDTPNQDRHACVVVR